MRAADTACYAGKEKGRNCIEVYHLDDQELIKQRNEKNWLSLIQQALTEDGFCLYQQKIILNPVEWP